VAPRVNLTITLDQVAHRLLSHASEHEKKSRSEILNELILEAYG
jgi:hypothetical protein